MVSSAEWYKYSIVYIGSLMTIAWLYLIRHGLEKDKLLI